MHSTLTVCDTAPENAPTKTLLGIGLLALPVALALLLALGLSNINQFMSLTLWLGGACTLVLGLRHAVTYGLIWLFTKAFWMRLAFHLDYSYTGNTASNWLGTSPSLFLAVICLGALIVYAHRKKHEPWTTPERWFAAFVGFALLSMLLPVAPMWVKLAGFQRNIFPTMAVAIVGYVAFSEPAHYRQLCRALLVLGILSTGYAIGQHLGGLPFWELTWFEDLNANSATGLNGWLTVGPAGLEFRVYSCFYSYTEFFFTIAGIILVNLGFWKYWEDRAGRILLITLIALFAVLLGLTLERMPMLMLLFGGLAAWSLASGKLKFKKRLVGSVLIALMLWVGALVALAGYLNSGVDKLVRLAELTNPFAASSIQDRVENQWHDALAAIGQKPWGWGLGYGSQTMASGMAKRTGELVAPHNELLQKSMELGIAGAILFLGLLVSQGRFVLRKILDLRLPDRVRGTYLGYFALLAAFLLCGMVNLTLSGSMGVLFWLVTGAMWCSRPSGSDSLPQRSVAT